MHDSTLLPALSALLVAVGCASPLDDRWYARGTGQIATYDVPHWVRDAWAAESALSSIAADERPTNTDDEVRFDSLAALIGHALANNPSVQAAEARWHAARQRIVQAQTLPEPELSYRVVIEQIDRSRDPVGHVFGLSQMFPWFGTLELAGDVAAAEARAAGQEYVARQLAVAAAVKEAWAEHAYIIAAESVLREHRDILTQLEAVVRTLYQTNQVAQRDLARVQQELDRITNDLHDLEDVQQATMARLNAAAGRRAESPLSIPIDLPDEPLELDERPLVALIEETNPELAGLRDRIAARRASIHLAEKRFYPDFMLGIEYGVNTSARMARMDGGGADMLAAIFSIRLPIWRESYEAGRREALAEWGEGMRMLTDRHNTLESDLKTALYEVREAERRRVLYGDVLRIRGEQVLQSTLTAYRAGEAPFTDLIQAQRELLEFERAHQRAVADRFAQLARIDAIVGRSIGATPDRAEGESP